jgi:DNA mismatch endonuclease (patch repair protein)
VAAPKHAKKPGHRSWAACGRKVPGKHRGDIMSVEKRSALMARIRGKGTGPEKRILKELDTLGLSCEQHASDLPGRPDVVFRKERVAVFVDGDFWHGWRFPLWKHKLSVKWRDKIEATRTRDARNFTKLRRNGWLVVRIWEHQIERSAEMCVVRIVAALRGKNASTRLK